MNPESLLQSNQILEQNEDIIAAIVENLQIGRYTDCMQLYSLLHRSIIQIGLELDNYPEDDFDPYQAIDKFPDQIMKKDLLEDKTEILQENLNISNGMKILEPPCKECAQSHKTMEYCRSICSHVDPNHLLSEEEMKEYSLIAQLLTQRNLAFHMCNDEKSKKSKLYKRWTASDRYSLLVCLQILGENYKEISRILNRSIGQIRGHISRQPKLELVNAKKGILPPQPTGYIAPPELAHIFVNDIKSVVNSKLAPKKGAFGKLLRFATDTANTFDESTRFSDQSSKLLHISGTGASSSGCTASAITTTNSYMGNTNPNLHLLPMLPPLSHHLNISSAAMTLSTTAMAANTPAINNTIPLMVLPSFTTSKLHTLPIYNQTAEDILPNNSTSNLSDQSTSNNDSDQITTAFLLGKSFKKGKTKSFEKQPEILTVVENSTAQLQDDMMPSTTFAKKLYKKRKTSITNASAASTIAILDLTTMPNKPVADTAAQNNQKMKKKGKDSKLSENAMITTENDFDITEDTVEKPGKQKGKSVKGTKIDQKIANFASNKKSKSVRSPDIAESPMPTFTMFDPYNSANQSLLFTSHYNNNNNIMNATSANNNNYNNNSYMGGEITQGGLFGPSSSTALLYNHEDVMLIPSMGGGGEGEELSFMGNHGQIYR